MSASNTVPAFGVSDFVAVFNQTLEFAYPSVSIVGEISNFRVSKNRWLYFDLKDENSKISFFGTIYNLPGPLEDGMMIEVKGQPRLHNLYGFSVNIANIKVSGEGSIKKAFALLEAKLDKEGLFSRERKRTITYPPHKIGLVASIESAAYGDFLKVLSARWRGVEISVVDVAVQGESAPEQIIAAINRLNNLPELPEVIVITRGGGSADDLAAFNVEQVVRAIGSSRVPTLVAIGHERDISLAERVADSRASTPSNAAELLVPDSEQIRGELKETRRQLSARISQIILTNREQLGRYSEQLVRITKEFLQASAEQLKATGKLLEALSPGSVLARGYAIVRDAGTSRVISSVRVTRAGQLVSTQFKDGMVSSRVEGVK